MDAETLGDALDRLYKISVLLGGLPRGLTSEELFQLAEASRLIDNVGTSIHERLKATS